MAIATTKYIRNPLYVDAVKVTKENFLEIAFWCRGSIKNNDESEVDESAGIDPDTQHIQLQRVNNPKNQRQTQAHVGDWILSIPDKGYKIYNDQAFRNSFKKVEGTEADAAAQAAKPQPTPIEGDTMENPENIREEETPQYEEGDPRLDPENAPPAAQEDDGVQTELVREPVTDGEAETPSEPATSSPEETQPDEPAEAPAEEPNGETQEAQPDGAEEAPQDAPPTPQA